MGKRRQAEAELPDLDPNAMRGNALGTAPPITSASTIAPRSNRGALLLHHLKALNDQFVNHLNSKLQSQPLELWVDDVQALENQLGAVRVVHSQDYLHHAKMVESSFQDVLQPPVQSLSDAPRALAAATNAKKEGGLGLGLGGRGSTMPAFSAGTSASPFAGISLTSPASTSGPKLEKFGGSMNGSSAPLFGAALQTPALPTPSTPPTSMPPTQSLFGGPASSTGSLFGSMGASQPLTFNLNSSANPFAAGGANLSIAVPNGAAAAGGDDDVEPPPSPTKVDRQGDEIMMLESKAKMLFQVNGDWKDMGVGSLSLRQAKKDAPVRVVMANNVGKFTLNAALYKGLIVHPVKGQPKQCSLALFNAEAKSEEGQQAATLTMLRFGKQDTLEKFKEILAEHTPK